VEELSESGRGIYIINKLMDKLYFEKNGNVAKAVLIKFL
jgi:anti-sigma regulatory factor (Ser/Thr protein kinase)